MPQFDTLFDRLIGHEGGYVNDPNDPGGETKWGISKRSYPHLDIKNLTRGQAKDLYRYDFWAPVAKHNLHPGVAWQLFDFAVNSGISTALKAYQRAVGVVDDGIIGSVTRRAIEAMPVEDRIMGLIAERLEFMTNTRNWPYHGRGWARRMADNLRYAVKDT